MKQPSSEQRKKRDVFYFVPGQVVMLVEHEMLRDDDDTQRLIESVRGKTYAADRLRNAVADPKRILVFDHGASDPCSFSARTADPQPSGIRFMPDNRSGQAYDVRDLRRASQDQFSLVFFEFRDENQEPWQLTALIDELNRENPGRARPAD